MSHDRGCPCGKEPYEYEDCTRQDCMRRKTRDLSINRERKVRGGTDNCVQCCIATIMDLPISAVPDFVKLHEERWLAAVQEWLRVLGYEIKMFEGYHYRDGLWLVDGRSPRNLEINHMIVMEHKFMFHDPHESSKGLRSIRRSYWIMPLDPAMGKT